MECFGAGAASSSKRFRRDLIRTFWSIRSHGRAALRPSLRLGLSIVSGRKGWILVAGETKLLAKKDQRLADDVPHPSLLFPQFHLLPFADRAQPEGRGDRLPGTPPSVRRTAVGSLSENQSARGCAFVGAARRRSSDPISGHYRIPRRNDPRAAASAERPSGPRQGPGNGSDDCVRHPPHQQPEGPERTPFPLRGGRCRRRRMVPPLGAETFGPLETMLAARTTFGAYCAGDTPGLADICLVAQVANGARFGVDMAPYPTIQSIHDACMAIPAFERAAPANQPDAE